MMTGPDRRSIRLILAWCLYDWAVSAFNTVVVTFVFATYFVRAVAPDPTAGTTDWAAAQSLAGLAIAFAAAPLGAVADQGGYRRAMLAVSTALVAACTAALWFVRPEPGDAAWALGCVGVATLAVGIAGVFYNALLPEVAPRGQIGRISGLAWGAGYAGGLVCLGLCLVLLVEPSPPLFGLSTARAEPVRATALFAAGWIAVFAWPIMIVAPAPAERLPWRDALRNGLAALSRTVRQAWGDLVMRQFLIARMLYTDGLNTLFAFGAIFAAGSFGMDVRETLMLGIALNVTAGLGAFSFAFVEDRIGPKPTIMISLVALTVLGILVLFAHSPRLFWVLALGLGVFVGPAQAASRSLMARLSPTQARNASFGLYALSGRVTGFLGPTALGVVTAATGSQRAGMAVIVVLVAAGGLLLAPLNLRPTI